MSMFVAFNQTKGAYLSLDYSKRWSLTTNPHIAHMSDKEKLESIVSQINFMPNDWVFYPVVDGTVQREENQAEEKPVIQGEWKATPEYNELLDAVAKFSSVVSKSKACELAQEVTKCNGDVIDMEHFIEFSDLGEDEGYAVYCKLRDLLRRRRNVKQQLELTNRILDSGVRQLTDGHTFSPAQETVRKQYTPRGDGSVFSDLTGA